MDDAGPKPLSIPTLLPEHARFVSVHDRLHIIRELFTRPILWREKFEVVLVTCDLEDGKRADVLLIALDLHALNNLVLVEVGADGVCSGTKFSKIESAIALIAK